MLVKLSDAAWLVARHERVVRRRLLLPEGEPGRLEAVKRGQVWMIDTADLSRLWTLDQARLDELQRRERRSPDVMAAQIATLQAQVRSLESRLARLEGSERHQTRYDGNLSEHRAEAMPAPRSRPTVTTARQLAPGEWPASANGRGKWIARHGGPGTSWARTFDDVLEWQGPEDAIAAVRRRQHWHDWQPHECADPACLCHELLGAGVPVDIEVSDYE